MNPIVAAASVVSAGLAVGRTAMGIFLREVIFPVVFLGTIFCSAMPVSAMDRRPLNIITEEYYTNLDTMRTLERRIDNSRARIAYYVNIPVNNRTQRQQEELIRSRQSLQESSLLQMRACRLTRQAATSARIIPNFLVGVVENRILRLNAALQYLEEPPRPIAPATPPRN